MTVNTVGVCEGIAMSDIRWARSMLGTPITPVQGMRATCFDCGAVMAYRKAHKRKRGLFAFVVQDHWMHVGDKAGCIGTGESAEHAAAKAKASQHAFTYSTVCTHCTYKQIYDMPDCGILEQRWCTRRLDVGFVSNKQVTGAVEIFRSHAVEDDKAREMCTGGLVWVEVNSRDVLAANPGDVVPAIRGSVPCAGCAKRHAVCAAKQAAAFATHVADHALRACTQAVGVTGCALACKVLGLQYDTLDFGEYNGYQLKEVTRHYLAYLSSRCVNRIGKRIESYDMPCSWIWFNKHGLVMHVRKLIDEHDLCWCCMQHIPNRPQWRKTCGTCYYKLENTCVVAWRVDMYEKGWTDVPWC